MNNESTINRVANVSLPPQLAELAADNVIFMICIRDLCAQHLFAVSGGRKKTLDGHTTLPKKISDVEIVCKVS